MLHITKGGETLQIIRKKGEIVEIKIVSSPVAKTMQESIWREFQRERGWIGKN